jgi:hypothetical protein
MGVAADHDASIALRLIRAFDPSCVKTHTRHSLAFVRAAISSMFAFAKAFASNPTVPEGQNLAGEAMAHRSRKFVRKIAEIMHIICITASFGRRAK